MPLCYATNRASCRALARRRSHFSLEPSEGTKMRAANSTHSRPFRLPVRLPGFGRLFTSAATAFGQLEPLANGRYRNTSSDRTCRMPPSTHNSAPVTKLAPSLSRTSLRPPACRRRPSGVGAINHLGHLVRYGGPHMRVRRTRCDDVDAGASRRKLGRPAARVVGIRHAKVAPPSTSRPHSLNDPDQDVWGSRQSAKIRGPVYGNFTVPFWMHTNQGDLQCPEKLLSPSSSAV